MTDKWWTIFQWYAADVLIAYVIREEFWCADFFHIVAVYTCFLLIFESLPARKVTIDTVETMK